MKRIHTLTSDTGDLRLREVKVLFVWFYWRQNIRPVSPTCKDIRTERGFRIGTFVFGMRRTWRVYKDTYQPKYMDTAL